MTRQPASRRLIFSINSGRSGSAYLHRLLDTARNVRAFHEARPAMAGRRISWFPAARPTLLDRLLYAAMYAKKYQKVRGVKRILRTLPPGHAYAETNHMFILSFYDVIMNHFRTVDVILVRRHMPQVLKSFIELNMFSANERRVTPYWAVSPNSRSAAVEALAPDGQMDQVDRCIAYLIDVEGRAQRFMAEYPRVHVVEARLEELNEWENVKGLFSRLDIEPTDATRSVVGRRFNQKTDRKAAANGTSEEYCRDRIQQYVEKCRGKSIHLPELPQLRKL